MKYIGHNIKKIRTTKGLSQQAFADIFELTRGNIASYEENRAEPKITVAAKIAKYFSIPFETFVTKTLTVNQILNFKGDKLLDAEKALDDLQLKEVPFLNDNIFLQCSSGKLHFNDWQHFSKLVLPSSSNASLVAINFNANIPHPAELPDLGQHDVLIFEALTENNFHLCENQLGLFIDSKDIMLGYYKTVENKLNLFLNELKSRTLDINEKKQFWRHYATYKNLN